ncbi:MAG: MBL fold metallo-hydrolase [Nevskiales bacterium]
MSPPEAKQPHHTAKGFRNNYPHERRGLKDFVGFLDAWDWSGPARVHFPLAQNDPVFLKENRQEPTLTWIGHDTFLIQLAGKNILTDPHFSARAFPVQFAGPKRWAPPGLALKQLPAIDLVFISHNHYDHLDEKSVKWIAKRNPQARFFVPLGLQRWFRRRGIKEVIELDWGQQAEHQGVIGHAVPVQHFSGRSATDRNKTLWCGWLIELAGQRIFFAGDSGYSKDFKDIGARFPGIDLALIPIGAYEPRWFMQAMHVNPEEAVKIHQDVKTRYSVAMHWGSFRLTLEPMDEPPRRLAAALQAAAIPGDRFWVMQHGETRKLDFLG